MTWEEWKDWSKLAIEDPSRNYCYNSDCGSCLGDDLKYQRELLQAFADELTKRMDAHYKSVYGDTFEARFKDTYVLSLNISKMLNEAGVEK